MKREKNIILQQPYQEEEEDVIGEFLFGNSIEQTKETIQKFWKIREKKIKLQ